jgi:hypothetical protein
MLTPVQTPQYNYPGYCAYSQPEDIVVGASPFVLYNDNAFPVRVFIIGGTVSDVSFQSEPWDEETWKSCGTPGTMVLNPHDSLQVTYSSAPTMSWTAF